MLCASLVVSLTIPNFTALAAQNVLPKLESREEVYVGSGDETVEITPYFNEYAHVNRQCEYVAQELDLNAQEKAALVAGAKAADDKYGSVKGFHARTKTNYLVNLKVLEICGVRIDTEADLEGYVLGRLPNINWDEEQIVKEMIAAIEEYVDGIKTREQKRYMIAGLGLHLIGDMFAHRAIIKKIWLNSWDQPDTDTVMHLKKKDFDEELLPDFEAKVRAGQLCTVGMRKYMAPPSGKYIDNIKFMPSRIKAAERAAASFVKTVFEKNLLSRISIIFLRNITCSWKSSKSIKHHCKSFR